MKFYIVQQSVLLLNIEIEPDRTDNPGFVVASVLCECKSSSWCSSHYTSGAKIAPYMTVKGGEMLLLLGDD